MTKRKILIPVIAVVAVVILALIALIAFVPGANPLIGGKNTPTSTASAKPDTKIDLTETKQFKDVSQNYSQFLTNGELGQTPAAVMVLGVSTATSYVNNAVFNPYFVSGYWGTKDNYMTDSVQKYISPYLSKNLNKTFMDTAKDPSKPTFNEFFNPRVYMPDANLQVNPQCYDTWKDVYCFADKPKVESLTYKGISETQVQVQLTAVVSVQYQKPDSPTGNMIAQTRAYNFSFVLDKTNPPASKDTDLPIMTISSMDASLEIRGQADYLINES